MAWMSSCFHQNYNNPTTSAYPFQCSGPPTCAHLRVLEQTGAWVPWSKFGPGGVKSNSSWKSRKLSDPPTKRESDPSVWGKKWRIRQGAMHVRKYQIRHYMLSFNLLSTVGEFFTDLFWGSGGADLMFLISRPFFDFAGTIRSVAGSTQCSLEKTCSLCQTRHPWECQCLVCVSEVHTL